MSPSSNQEPSGSWDSIHVFESVERGRQAHYKLTSTIMLQLTTRQASQEGGENEKKSSAMGAGSNNGKYKDISFNRQGEVTLSGSMTRQVCVQFRFVMSPLYSLLFWLDERFINDFGWFPFFQCIFFCLKLGCLSWWVLLVFLARTRLANSWSFFTHH